MLHLARGPIRERQGENGFARQLRVCFKKMADSFGDDASLTGARARNYQQRSFAMMDGRALCGVEFLA
jgi:hypothetical protein